MSPGTITRAPRPLKAREIVRPKPLTPRAEVDDLGPVEQKQENPSRGRPRTIERNPLGHDPGRKQSWNRLQASRSCTYRLLRGKQPSVLGIAVQEDYGTERQQGGIEPEDVFVLEDGNFALVEARGDTDSARSGEQTMESARTNALMILWRGMQNLELSRRYSLVAVTRRSKSSRKP